jgi:hypothetical protein
MSSLSRLKFDIEQAHRVDGDRVAARSGATELLGALDGVFDPLADFTAVVAAQDVGFDWNGLAMSERLARTYTVRAREIARYRDIDQIKVVHAYGLILNARAATRQNLAAKAYAYSKAALISVRDAAGSPDRLDQLLRSQDPNLVADACVAVLGIAPTAARLRGLPTPRRDELIDRCRQLMRLYALENPGPPEYARSFAAAVQNLYAEAKFPSDPQYFWRLVELEGMWRPTDWRGQASRRLVDVAIGEYTGVKELAHVAFGLAKAEMAAAGLNRAVDAMSQRGWAPPRAA